MILLLIVIEHDGRRSGLPSAPLDTKIIITAIEQSKRVYTYI